MRTLLAFFLALFLTAESQSQCICIINNGSCQCAGCACPQPQPTPGPTPSAYRPQVVYYAAPSSGCNGGNGGAAYHQHQQYQYQAPRPQVGDYAQPVMPQAQPIQYVPQPQQQLQQQYAPQPQPQYQQEEAIPTYSVAAPVRTAFVPTRVSYYSPPAVALAPAYAVAVRPTVRARFGIGRYGVVVPRATYVAPVPAVACVGGN